MKMQNKEFLHKIIVLLPAVVITYLKKYSPHADPLPHTLGVTPWNSLKKKKTCTHYQLKKKKKRKER